MIKKTRRIVLILWIIIVLLCGLYTILHPDLLDPHRLLLLFRSFGTWAIVLYIFVSMFRSIILLPSLPLIFVGIIYAPDMPNTVYLISMMGVWFSGSLIYQFSHILGLDEIFSKQVRDKNLKQSIEKYGAYIIAFWSFFPILPIDVACYLAGTVRLPFWKFITAITVGEGIVIAIIIYGGKGVMQWFGF